MHTSFRGLGHKRRATLDALCRRIVPAANGGGAAITLSELVEHRLTEADPRTASRVSSAIRLLGSPLASMLAGEPPRAFHALADDAQDRCLAAWERSRVPLMRTAYQALRRLVLSTWYARPEAQRAIGYPGVPHERAPMLPWEGPLPGTPGDDDPVARSGSRVSVGWSGSANIGAATYAANADWLRRNAVPQGVKHGWELPPHTLVQADVCVIGSGAGGAVAAARLAEAGHEVIILEEGGYWTGADLTENEGDMMPRLYADSAMRATEDLAVTLLQGRAAGGSTTVNWLVMLRTPEWVLDEWLRDHGVDWASPISFAAVLDLVESETHSRRVPEDAHSPNNRIILDGAAKLGWHAHSATINARDCVRAGTCGLGCRYGAKQGATATYIPRALAAGARMFTDARAERVMVVERGGRAPLKRVHATVLERSTGAGRAALTIEAPVVVLAGGAVETPALLQRSGMGGGGVGRWLRLHPTSAVIGRYERQIQGGVGIPLSAVCDEFLPGENGYGFWIECPPLLPSLAAVAIPGAGSSHAEIMSDYARLGGLIVLVRDGMDRGRSNGEVRVDRQGRPRIHYRMANDDAATMRRGLEAAARMHLAAGAREVITLHAPPCRLTSERDVPAMSERACGPNQLALFSAHVNGTCRMGTDPRTSGSTIDGERHGVPGLYVADGSLLPTAPGANPQQTIMAVATVISRRIADRHPR